MNQKVKLFIESMNGHDEKEVSPEELREEVKTQLVNGKWVTLEHGDGSNDLLTVKDIPGNEEDEDEDEDADAELLAAFKDKGTKKTTPSKPTTTTKREEWESKFEDVQTATATHKTKGG